MVIDYLNDFERKREWTGLKGDIKKYIILNHGFHVFGDFLYTYNLGFVGSVSYAVF
ncbi:hypothetical protein [Eubacterium sp. AF17-7]|jgi:hypothetical protein|uniref:hypothetical protein n=1 Tax=Eubacterium sp. AF17-7 TaxID=2293105 RepID=UPI001314AD02|nr:hypothetical protein [Eubacterium sp. AF17-7]